MADSREREDNSSLVPYEGGGLGPLRRRALTRADATKPSRHEVGSLIDLTPDETQHVLTHANAAAIDINRIQHTLTQLPPGETVTVMEGTRTSDTQEDKSKSRERSAVTTLTGYAFIAVNFTERTTEETTETESSKIHVEEQTAGRHVARTRPAAFLTGGQVRNALRQIAIAKDQGLLFLPAANQRLSDQQDTTLGTIRRVIADYGGVNPSWAQDIQSGTIEGLIEQVQQTGRAIREGAYASSEVEEDLTDEARHTLHEELHYDLTQSFVHLLRFSLLAGQESVISKAAEALRDCLTKDVFPKDPERGLALLERWYEVFSQEANGRNAEIVGWSLSETLVACTVLADQVDNSEIFDGVVSLLNKAVEAGGAKHLLDVFVTHTFSTPPTERVISVYTPIVDLVDSSHTPPAVITLIRYSLLTGGEESNSVKIPKLVGLLSRTVSRQPINVRFKDDMDCSLSLLQMLADSLSTEEFGQLKHFVMPETGEVEAVVHPTSNKDELNSTPKTLDVLKDEELIAVVRRAFVRRILFAVQEGSWESRQWDRETFKYMYEQSLPEDRERLVEMLTQRISDLLADAERFIGEHEEQILSLANNDNFLGSAFNFVSYRHDYILVRDLERLRSPQDYYEKDKSLSGALEPLVEYKFWRIAQLLDRIYKYKNGMPKYLGNLKASWNFLAKEDRLTRILPIAEVMHRDESVLNVLYQKAHYLVTIVSALAPHPLSIDEHDSYFK